MAIAVTLLTVISLAGCTTEKHDGGANEIVTSLRGLVAENGLFMRPGLSAEGEPSWPASAYGLSSLRVIGKPAPRVASNDTLLPGLKDQIAQEPIWGRWYGVQVEKAFGSPISGVWADGILNDLRLPQDAAGQVATIAALADVVAAKSIAVPEHVRADLSARLNSAMSGTHNPFSWCRAMDAAKILSVGLSGAEPAAATEIKLGQAFSAESLTDVYGTLCLAQHQGRQLGEQQLSKVQDWLRPQLSLDVAGFEFEAYFAVKSWLLSGGDPATLAAVADKLRARVDAGSGLLRQHVVRLGTVENTYYAAVIADTFGAAASLIQARTLVAVRDTIPLARGKGAITDLLMSAVILRLAGKPDPALEQEAGGAAREWLSGGVDRAKAVRASQVMTMLQQLGQQVNQPIATVFPVRDDEDRYLAWTLLANSHHFANGDQVRQGLTEAVAKVGPAIAEPDQLTVREIAAAMRVPNSSVDRNKLPAKLSEWAVALRGCEGFPVLYRPLLTERRCTLEATAQMIASGMAQITGLNAGEST